MWFRLVLGRLATLIMSNFWVRFFKFSGAKFFFFLKMLFQYQFDIKNLNFLSPTKTRKNRPHIGLNSNSIVHCSIWDTSLRDFYIHNDFAYIFLYFLKVLFSISFWKFCSIRNVIISLNSIKLGNVHQWFLILGGRKWPQKTGHHLWMIPKEGTNQISPPLQLSEKQTQILSKTVSVPNWVCMFGEKLSLHVSKVIPKDEGLNDWIPIPLMIWFPTRAFTQ